MIKRAYAKINLGLKVLGKRNDGFHDLKTVMININLFDTLYAYKNKNIIVRMSKNVCEMKDNIVYKALMIMKEKYRVSKGIKIYIKKRILDGGGLGGGSSDAGMAILMANKIWELNLSLEELEEIANAVGSDVCFFLYNKLCFVEGRGDIVRPIDKNVNKSICLVIPKYNFSTKLVYENCDNTNSNYDINDLVNNIDGAFYEFMDNDLEKASLKVYPEYELDMIKNCLNRYGAKKAMMSGSGSIVFGIGEACGMKYRNISKELKGYKVLKCKTISCCKE